MRKTYSSVVEITDLDIWNKKREEGSLFSFNLDITARCNNNCRHCYINLPASDHQVSEGELSFDEIKAIAQEALSAGAFGCLMTGGEPLIRDDFEDIYHFLKKMGFMVSVFTNATLIREKHVKLFKQYPPRYLEVTVYGISKEIYGRVTRRPDLFQSFMKGINLLLETGVPVSLKTVVMESNKAEFKEIAQFCRKHSSEHFRFDPFLQFRVDGDADRNNEIVAERLSPDEIVYLEKSDPDRMSKMNQSCNDLIIKELSNHPRSNIFICGAGKGEFSVSWNGEFRLCGSLVHPECTYDLRKGTLLEALNAKVQEVRKMRSTRSIYLEKCGSCPIINLCMWCPASAFLETGQIDMPVNYFCEVAHSRAKMLDAANSENQQRCQMV